MPLAEQTGLIQPLTRYVLDAALAPVRALAATRGMSSRSPSTSRCATCTTDAAREVAALLRKLGARRGELPDVEITESAIVRRPGAAEGGSAS